MIIYPRHPKEIWFFVYSANYTKKINLIASQGEVNFVQLSYDIFTGLINAILIVNGVGIM